MNKVLKSSFALALALTLAGCSLFGPSKARSYSCDRGTCSGSGAMDHSGQASQK